VDEPAGIEEFQDYLGINFHDPGLLQKALTHSSAKSPSSPCNERLEFLGDSILGLVIAETVFRDHPGFDEGDLTRVKSEVVSSRTLARVGKKRGYDRFVQVGKGLRHARGLPNSLVAGVMEAIIGAIYLDQGLEAARAFILDCLGFQIENVLANRHRKNFKSILQNHTQKHLGMTPLYRVVSESGPDHGKVFEVQACLGPKRFPVGRGRSKKDAEQYAAEYAFAVLTSAGRTCLPVRIEDTIFPLPWGASPWASP